MPKPPADAGEALGYLVASGSGCFGCSRPYVFVQGGCCNPSPPSGDKWDAAWADVEATFLELDTLVAEGPKCCFSPDLEAVKTLLDRDYMPKVKELLQKHGFTADLYFFWSYNGQSSQPHLWMRIFAHGPK